MRYSRSAVYQAHKCEGISDHGNEDDFPDPRLAQTWDTKKSAILDDIYIRFISYLY